MATTIVAVAGAVIACFQFLTAHRKLMLDLFDRRLKVFESAIGPFLTNGKLSVENFNDFLRAKAAARFLFGQDVQDHVSCSNRISRFSWLIPTGRLSIRARRTEKRWVDRQEV
jgi:protein gp37